MRNIFLDLKSKTYSDKKKLYCEHVICFRKNKYLSFIFYIKVQNSYSAISYSDQKIIL